MPSMFLNEPDVDVPTDAMNYVHTWAWRQDVTGLFFEARDLLGGTTTLSPSEIAIINTAVALRRKNEACSLAWGAKLAAASDPGIAAALLRGETQGMSDRERALAGWAAIVADDPNATSDADIGALHAAGFDDRKIAEATMLAVFRLAFTAFNDALGVKTDAHLVADAPEEVRAAVTFGHQ
jgi:alkylhydroperoxidase family enzyme